MEAYQQDMRTAYLGGATGVLVSGLVWLAAGLVALLSAPGTSIVVFFLGGTLIYPLGMVLAKLLGRNGKHQKRNPLAFLALESTAILFIGLFLAYAVFQLAPRWFFPVMLLMIGVRYLVFQTIYGMRVYWVLGLTLIVTGAGCLVSNQPFATGGLVGGVIEIGFGIFMLLGEKKRSDP